MCRPLFVAAAATLPVRQHLPYCGPIENATSARFSSLASSSSSSSPPPPTNKRQNPFTTNVLPNRLTNTNQHPSIACSAIRLLVRPNCHRPNDDNWRCSQHQRLAKHFEKLVRADERYEVTHPVTMGLVCFRLKVSKRASGSGWRSRQSRRIRAPASQIGWSCCKRFERERERERAGAFARIGHQPPRLGERSL